MSPRGSAVNTATRPTTSGDRDGIGVVEEEENGDSDGGYHDDDGEDDENGLSEDEEEAATRRRIEEWIIELRDFEFERPPSPDIEDDEPTQTDTAIHIVYDGD